MSTVYLAHPSSMVADAEAIAAILRGAGHTVYVPTGAWRKGKLSEDYEAIADINEQAVERCDMVVLVAHLGMGAWWEAGIASVYNKPVVVVGPPPDDEFEDSVYCHHKLVARVRNPAQLLQVVEQIFRGGPESTKLR